MRVVLCWLTLARRVCLCWCLFFLFFLVCLCVWLVRGSNPDPDPDPDPNPSVSGFDYRTNELMAENGCCQALAGFCLSSRPDVQALAARALGRCAWNGESELQVMNTLARQAWVGWVDRLASEGDTMLRRKEGELLARARLGQGLVNAAGAPVVLEPSQAQMAEVGPHGGEQPDVVLQEVYRETKSQGVIVEFAHAASGEDLYVLVCVVAAFVVAAFVTVVVVVVVVVVVAVVVACVTCSALVSCAKHAMHARTHARHAPHTTAHHVPTTHAAAASHVGTSHRITSQVGSTAA